MAAFFQLNSNIGCRDVGGKLRDFFSFMRKHATIIVQ